jgi:HEAT repeat protein
VLGTYYAREAERSYGEGSYAEAAPLFERAKELLPGDERIADLARKNWLRANVALLIAGALVVVVGIGAVVWLLRKQKLAREKATTQTVRISRPAVPVQAEVGGEEEPSPPAKEETAAPAATGTEGVSFGFSAGAAVAATGAPVEEAAEEAPAEETPAVASTGEAAAEAAPPAAAKAPSAEQLESQEVSVLAEALANEDEDVRFTAARKLGRIGPDAAEAARALGKALKDESARVRQEAAGALFRIGPAGEKAASALAKAVQDDSPEVRRMVLEALGAVAPAKVTAVKAMTKALGDSEWEVRCAAAEALGHCGGSHLAEQAREALSAGLQDEREEVQKVAQASLDRLG